MTASADYRSASTPPPTQDAIDEVEELREEQKRASNALLVTSNRMVAASARVVSKRASARERRPSRAALAPAALKQ